MSSSSENEEPELQTGEKQNEEPFYQLPARSQSLYLNAYDKFMKWRKDHRVELFTEDIFLTYFNEIAKKYQSSTLWSIFSMLRTTMQTKHSIDIKNYVNLTSYLKKLSTGYKAKKSKVFTRKNIQDFINKAPNERYLATKVALIFGVSGACRVTELANLTLNDIETDTHLQAIHLPKTKTNKERKFVISGEFLEIVKVYQELRPAGVTTPRFFLNYQHGKCTTQVIGKNKFSTMPKQIATYLKLPNPEQYTGHCFRRTSATLLVDSGVNMTSLQCHGGEWKSDPLAGHYIEIVPTSPQPSTSRD